MKSESNLLLRASVFGLVIALFGGPAPAQVVTGLGSVELDQYIAQQMWQMRTPGLAVLVVKDGEVIWAKGYGQANIELQVPVAADTVFHLSSIAKLVVATAVMQLWEDGALDLDGDINDHLPFSVRNPLFPDVPITSRMLLAHDSSLTFNGRPQEAVFADAVFGADSPVSLEEFLGSFFISGGENYNPALVFNTSHPGTFYEYSNLGYVVLGYLVERISGVPFDEYCNANIFEPLGMDRTTWRLADLFAAGIEPAMPYIFAHAEQVYFPYGHTGQPEYPAQGLRSSADDLAKLLIAFMNGGAYGGVQILEPATVALMQTPVHTSDKGPIDAPYLTYAYGLGISLVSRGPQQRELMIGHAGEWIGTVTAMHYRPHQSVGVIALANAAGGILLPVGPAGIPGRQVIGWTVLSQRLLDEAAAAP
jgi:CubicO group peptidase (beta-lactamase class C family)